MFGAPSGEDVVMAGQTRLMGVQDLSDLDRLRELFDAFARKRELLQLLEGCIHAQGVRLFIGEESGLAPLDQCSARSEAALKLLLQRWPPPMS